MDLVPTVRFYQSASDELLDCFEDALDNDDPVLAEAIRDEFLTQAATPETTKTGKIDEHAYLSEDPQVGDMCFLNTCNRHVRLIAISDDRKLALVKEQFGVYTAPFDKLRRVR